MEILNKNGMEFITINDDNIMVGFSTAKADISFKLGSEKVFENFNTLKEIFQVNKVNYTKQVHGDRIIDLNDIDSKEEEADALILSKKNEIVGVFTADCVPVILYDKEKQIVAAVHSGWKGTILDISKKTALKMMNDYGCKNIKVVIGPSVGRCCYEVSEDLIAKFIEKYGESVATNRMLDLKEAIKLQLKDITENIIDLNVCTVCCKNYELHSYRKDAENSGRLFSFVLFH